MGVIMQINNMVENVRASFAMEDMFMTQEDEKRGLDILTGKINIEKAIEDIRKKYASVPGKV